MLKEYTWKGSTWQFDERDAPAGAVEVVRGKPAGEPVAKAKPAANKARAPRNKAAR